MSEKALKQLVGALAVVAVLWVMATLVSRAGDGSIAASGELAGFFDGASESSVEAARILRAGDSIRLSREGDAWTVNGFRADSGSVARFFQTLEGAEVGDLIATNPANHERMGVSADGASTLELVVGGSTRSLLFGNEGPRPSTLYARRPGADEVHLVEGALGNHLQRPLDDWRNRRMLVIDTSRVTRLAVQRDDDAYTLVRADSVWTFADGGAVRAPQVQSILSELGGGVVASRFVAEDDSLAALPEGGSTVALSEGGDVLAEVRIGSGTGERWAMVAGDSVRYRLPSFRVDLIVPSLESVQPSSDAAN
jgi:hypothetical protein